MSVSKGNGGSLWCLWIQRECQRSSQEPVPRQHTAAGFVSRNTVVPRMEMVTSVGVADVD